jgi:7-cyano-7-deazaguanine synthase
MTTKALVVLSGGQDSTTCLYWAKHDFVLDELHAVTFDYGQRHRVEIEAACVVANMAGVTSHEIIELGPILKSTSPLVSNAQLEQYADHASLPGGIEKTFVPMRNQLFLTIAMNRAIALGCKWIITGVCEEDYGGYPDCRSKFIEAIERASHLGTYDDPDAHATRPRILTPLMKLSKASSVKVAVSLPGCMEALAYSHTAYDGAYPPTGHDHATLLRAKGFEEAGVPDPLILRAHREGLMALPASANYSDTVR